jgi:hypothetical protein
MKIVRHGLTTTAPRSVTHQRVGQIRYNGTHFPFFWPKGMHDSQPLMGPDKECPSLHGPSLWSDVPHGVPCLSHCTSLHRPSALLGRGMTVHDLPAKHWRRFLCGADPYNAIPSKANDHAPSMQSHKVMMTKYKPSRADQEIRLRPATGPGCSRSGFRPSRSPLVWMILLCLRVNLSHC